MHRAKTHTLLVYVFMYTYVYVYIFIQFSYTTSTKIISALHHTAPHCTALHHTAPRTLYLALACTLSHFHSLTRQIAQPFLIGRERFLVAKILQNTVVQHKIPPTKRRINLRRVISPKKSALLSFSTFCL